MSRTFLLFAVSLGLLFVPRIAAGCVLVPKPTVLDAYNDADVVVIARAISVEKVSDPSEIPMHGSRVVSTMMEVQKVFKGNLSIGSKMTFGQGNGIRCTWVFYEDVIGDEFLFYLQNPPDDSKLWYEFGYSRSDATSRVADDLLYLNNIEAVRGRTRVSGTMSDNEPGRKIWILGKGKVYETTTDKNGVFELYDLPPGRYALEPEMPFGWKIDRMTIGTTTVSDRKQQIRGRHILFTLKPRQHAAIDIAFVLDNVISGSVVDARGRPLSRVQVSLQPMDVNNKSINFEYTDEQGRFAIESIDPGNYIIVVNEDGEKTVEAPFSVFYYPNVTEQARARIFRVRAGDNIKGLKIVPNTEEMVTVKGVVRYVDGTPARKATVRFKSAKMPGVNGDALEDTNAQGQFSFKILKGLPGELRADFFAYSGSTAAIIGEYDYAKCPQVQTIMKQTGEELIKTPALRIDAKEDLLNLVLTFPFRPCKTRPVKP